jgi:hypothetical protein
MNTEQEKKRLHEGGVGPAMRSLAGLSVKNTTGAASTVNGVLPNSAGPA